MSGALTLGELLTVMRCLSARIQRRSPRYVPELRVYCVWKRWLNSIIHR